MLLSQIFAWVSVLLCLLEVFRLIARISRSEPQNRFFHRIHIPLGVLLLVTGCAHGLLAGNPSEASLAEMQPAPVLFTVNWGTLCFLCAVLLALSYCLRRVLRRKWIAVHRALTVLMLALLVLHLAEVGIRLPQRWGNPRPPAGTESALSAVSPSPAADPAAQSPSRPPVSAPPPASSEPASSGPASSAVFQPSETPEPSEPEPSEPEPGLADGEYVGSAMGRNGEIAVSVTVAGGKIADIQVVSHMETPRYFVQAESVISAILSAGSADVDAVTGATISSEAIKAAVADALEP